MKYTLEEVQTKEGTVLVLLSFTGEKKGSILKDADLYPIIKDEGLRSVNKSEFESLRLTIRNTTVPIAAFGNEASGNSEARFTGVPFLDTDGKVKVMENWTRGGNGDEWYGQWKFAFARTS
ncbi:MAG: hypothetical protein R3B55_02205 [Candidatus Paceibacterota bacterium]